MRALMSILFRNVKTIFFTLIALVRRVFCCFRNKTKTDKEPYVIDSSNFVVVQQQQQPLLNSNSQHYSAGQSRNFGFSNQSLVDRLPNSPKDEWNNDEWIADVKPSSNKQETAQQEPDYFADMTPQFTKQKKYFIEAEQEQAPNAPNKFGINSAIVNANFDDNKFEHSFGSLEAQQGHEVSSWDDEVSDIDQTLAQVRREQRHQHQHHHHHHQGYYQS